MATRRSGAATVAPDPEPVEQPYWAHAATPRQGKPDAVLTHPNVPALSVTLGHDGILRPASPDEVRLADALGLPVIHPED